jgi:hypothetical protein
LGECVRVAAVVGECVRVVVVVVGVVVVGGGGECVRMAGVGCVWMRGSGTGGYGGGVWWWERTMCRACV